MKNLSWYISLGITFAGFLIIGHFFTLNETEPLKNYNPAFIPIVILIPFLLLSLFITFLVGAHYFRENGWNKRFIAIALIILIFFIAGVTEYQFIADQIEAFGGNWNDAQSLIYGLSPLNAYTNDWYFNESVFLIIHAIAYGCGLFLMNKKPEIEQ